MNFAFFTLGGSLFWEDVFFYQKWRIQRNCFTKKYRLLDSWDIRRACGTFETCQKAFVNYIESHEITKQKGDMIILLHGYMDSKNIFKNLWRKLVLTQSTVAALNYASNFRSALASAHQLVFFLNHIEDIDNVSFVTKGAGNLVLQNMFNLPNELLGFKERIRIKNIVLINPVIKENLPCELLSKFRIFRFIFGPMMYDMTKKGLKNIPLIPSDLNCIKIFYESKADEFFYNLLRMLKFPIEEKKAPKKSSIFIKGSALRGLNDDKVLNSVVKFINNGKI